MSPHPLVEATRLEVAATLRTLTRDVNREVYSGPWTLDPEAFPEPLRLVPRLRRRMPDQWACGMARFDTEQEARDFADQYNARVTKVKRWRVPKGTKHVAAAIDVLAKCLAALPAWDEMEQRRRVAFWKWQRRNRTTFIHDPDVPPDRIYSIALAPLTAWLPKAESFGGETIVVPVHFGGGPR